jgi:hypothetical protein
VIPPRKEPPPWKTAHNVAASPRMARLYWFLRDNGVAIGDWATDANVEGELLKLKKLQVQLGVMAMDADHSARHLAEVVLLDLENLMRRRPSARVT